jgi:tight adherence protein C
MTTSAVTGAAALGMGVGLGLFLLLRIVAPPRVAVSVALARIDAAALSHTQPTRARGHRGVAAGRYGRWSRRLQAVEWLLGERYAAALAERGLLGAGLRSDLALLGRDERAYTAHKLLAALATLLLSPVLLVPASLALGTPWLVAAWVSVLAAAGAFLLPDARVRRAARERRRDFAAAIAAYLDLVAMRAASGSGVAEALRDAARIGSGGAFALLREALDDARLAGQSPAWGLRLLGEELDVVELRQLSAQLQLIDASGAQAEASLRAKADALRARQLTDAHGGANAQSQTMLIAQILLGLGFLIFLGYPALAQVLAI